MNNQHTTNQHQREENDHNNGPTDKKGIEECPVCKNVYDDKHWKHSINDIHGEHVAVAHELICPACTMIKDHTFEGEVIVEGIPEAMKGDLSGLIANFGTHATTDNPQHRIIAAEDNGTSMRITTTENQMAERLGKQIHSAMKGTTIDISHRDEPYQVTRVHLVFKHN